MSPTAAAQKTRERVLQMAREIEQLSHKDLPTQAFFRQFLDLLVRSLGARAGAVWMLAAGRMNLTAEVGLAEIGFKDNPQAPALNHRLLAGVMSDGQACTHAPGDPGVQLPTPHLHILAALYAEKECVGVVQVFQRADSPAEARPGYLQFVEQMTGYASRYLERQRSGVKAPDPAKFWDDFEQYVLQLQRTLDEQEVASTAVNDGRLLLGADRVSLAVRRGKKVSIKAVSGEDVVNARSNLIRAMRKLCERTMAMRERVQYTGKVENLAPQIEEPLANFIQESGSRMVIAIPLFESEPLVESDDKSAERQKSEDRRKTIGCLIVEQVNESHPRPGLLDHVNLVADHVSAALHNAQCYHRLFLMPLWRFLGTCLEWFHGRKLAKLTAALVVVAALAAALVYVPWDYRVEGVGRLMPVTQREVFATWDGEVVEVLVQGGQRVQAGQPLVRLKNDQLNAERIAVDTQLNEKRSLLLALQAQMDDVSRTTGSREDLIKIQGQMAATRVEIKGLEAQQAVLEERWKQLTIVAPIDGVVATFQVEELLKNRPVRMGEILLEVMDDSGDWRLELEVEESRMGHLLSAQNHLGKQDLDIEFILATKTEATYRGKLASIATRAEKNPDLGAVFEVYGTIDADDLPDEGRRIGAEVRAKITCQKRALGYVLFGDVIEFFRKQLWL